MLRVPLDGLILQIKLLGLGEPSDFLGMLVQEYLLYWYKSTCFTGTKAQTLILLALLVQEYLLYWYKSTGFTGTKVLALLVQKHKCWRVL